MELFTLKDNTVIQDDFRETKLCNKLIDKTLGQLTDGNGGLFVWPPVEDGNNPDLDKTDCVLFHRGGKEWTGNLMGFLGCGEERLVITSRFSESQGHGNDYFLHYMLRKVLAFSFINLEIELDRNSPFYRILELLFPSFLQSAMKKGIYKIYFRKQFDDSHCRGVIDIPRFIRDDLPFTGNISYNTREYLTDNPVTELIRHTIESIVSQNNVVSAMLKRNLHCRQAVQAVRMATRNYRRQDRNKVIAYNMKHSVRSGYFHPYRDLQRLCIAILRDKRASVIGNDAKKVYGILFNGASLWEEYLNLLLKEGFDERDSELIHPNNRIGSNKQYFFEDKKTGRNIETIYPDYIVSKENGSYILDAKYKPSENAGGGDWKQILSYMLRFESKFGALLYPHGNGDDGNVLQEYSLLRGIGSQAEGRDCVHVAKLGLKIPTVPQEYATQDTFDKKMRVSERHFMDVLTRYCC